MHHLHSRSAVIPFRLAALLLLVIGLLATVAVALLLQSILTASPHTAVIGSGLMTLSLALGVPLWVVGARTDCPMCWVPVLGPKSGSKHRQARRFLGSHRLRVTLAILFKNQFRCPFCNESTELVQPQPPHRAADHWAQLD